MAHWRGAGPFADASVWETLGRQHLELYDEFARAEGKTELRRVIEWGCGGGANAVHFAPRAREFCGIDVASDTLDECARQVSLATNGRALFQGRLVRPDHPEDARDIVKCDFFLSTYVFELLPSPENGLRVLDVASELLEPGGLAIIQIKYAPDGRVPSTRRRYDRYFYAFTRFRINDFWCACDQRGLEPRSIKLVPVQPLDLGDDYAYFMLRKR
jgi:SAM-dependent methyltransferase